ncbi:Aste57867_17961 [Aphanomyces stellatus]|uniref:Aste57867_17961 protein n=1 Tax=Aphanomyces stellatus TaxID=120398 RepID=A0A485L8T5_9STRA|nr:hypothetical protein As57867_017899 [Aphanomyces stellatus]VFT94701.1 Aste57867_17961 [Aphanomyces stellatus]
MLEDRRPLLVAVPPPGGNDDDALAFLMQNPGLDAHRDTVVDVACAPSTEDAYSGDIRLRQSVELKFGDFLDYFHAKRTDQAHWLRETEDDLQFYLAQCPLFTSSPQDTPAVLSELLPGLPPKPSILGNDVALTQINLWMTVAPSETSVHYDAYENVLHVLAGAKHVRLYPPTATPHLCPHPVYSKSANHTTLSLADSKALDACLHMDFTVLAHQALYIPEGWWHQVRSDAFTVAVNYWFDGMRPTLLRDPLVVPYYARVLLEDMMRLQRETCLANHVDTARQRVLAKRPSTLLESTEALEGWLVSVQGTAAHDDDAIQDVLLAAPSAIVYQLGLVMAKSHPRLWQTLLEYASEVVVERWTELWDDHKGVCEATEVATASDYFGQIFATCNDPSQLQQTFLAKKDAFAAKCARDVMRLMFGFEK